MRLWSIHPRYLDAKGLVALWREGLLARAVFLDQTRGYKNHPQLKRFGIYRDPVALLECYLSRVLDEARNREYSFDATKIRYRSCRHRPMVVTNGQLVYEWKRLLSKLAERDRTRWNKHRNSVPQPHGCFIVVPGPIADWERV